MAHARLSASAAHRWMLCPGSVALNAAIPDTSSAASAEGTAAHDAAAEALRAGFGCAPSDPDVAEYVNYCWSQIKDGCAYHVEVDLTPGLRLLDPDLGGTADFVRYDSIARDLLIADLKFGRGIAVDVDNNHQLMLYALGALLTFPEYRPVTVTAAIFQPRIERLEGPVQTATLDAETLLDFAADVREAALRSRYPDAPLVPGEKQCQWCKAKATCPALEKHTHALVAQDFDMVPATVDPVKLQAALDMIPAVEARIKALRDLAYAELARGRAVPGYKLVEKRATRKWADEEKAKAALAPHGDAVYDPPTLKSPAQVEKIIGKKNFAPLADLAPAVSSGYTVVPETDKRPAVALVAESDFPVLPGPVDAE